MVTSKMLTRREVLYSALQHTVTIHNAHSGRRGFKESLKIPISIASFFFFFFLLRPILFSHSCDGGPNQIHASV